MGAEWESREPGPRTGRPLRHDLGEGLDPLPSVGRVESLDALVLDQIAHGLFRQVLVGGHHQAGQGDLQSRRLGVLRFDQVR